MAERPNRVHDVQSGCTGRTWNWMFPNGSHVPAHLSLTGQTVCSPPSRVAWPSNDGVARAAATIVN
jgi:hypothetical protein